MIAGQQLLADISPLLLPDQLPESYVRPEFDEEKHRYSWPNGKRMPGVTSILNILDKPALPYWGMRVGLRAAHEMVQRGFEVKDFSADPQIEGKNDVGDWERTAKAERLTIYTVKDEATKRGTSAHNAAEAYLKHGTAPDLKTLNEEAKGYVQSAAACLIELELKPVGVEVMVWHSKLGYAGTFDILAYTEDGRLGLLDYKTSKDVYDSHFLQLGAYEGARRSLRLQPVDFCAVLHLTPDGEWSRDTHWQEISGSEVDATIKDFESIHATYAALERRKERQSQAKKNAKAAAKAAQKKEATDAEA